MDPATPTGALANGASAVATDSNSETITFCKKKSVSVNRQIAELNHFLTPEQLNGYDDVELSVRLEFVERMQNNFESVQASLEEADPNELDSTARGDFIETYFEVKAKLSREINLQRKSNGAHSSTVRHFGAEEGSTTILTCQRKTRLPELKIPKFGGAYTDWPNFFAMYNSVIDKDAELSKVERFQHLRASLQGAALDTICSLEPNAENYDKALELLKNRFDNKLLIFQAHIKAIFGLKGVEKGSATGLRELSDKFNSHLRALNTLASRESISDGMLIHLIVSRLDQKTQEMWEEGLPIHELPTWTAMSSFLEKRCRMLENLESAMVTPTPSHQVGKISNNTRINRNVFIAAIDSILCVFCDSKEHYISSCSRFMNLSPSLRYKEAKKLHLCLNCLRKGHNLQRCKSGHCRHCSAKHHSLLHMNSAPPNALPPPSLNTIEAPSDSPIVSANTSQSALISSSSPNPTPNAANILNNYVLLATAVLFVKNRSGIFVSCRAILDSASQLNFVTTRLANQLQLQSRNSHISISGIGVSSFVANKAVDIFAKSQSGDFTTSFTAVVTLSITDYQPNVNLNISDWNIPQNLKLTDPQFFKSQRIDLLIGAGLFFDLMCVGQIRIANNLPTLQKTRLGWVISGGVSYTSKRSSILAAFTKNITEKEDDISLNDIVKKFWEVENCFDSTSSASEEDIWCEQHFQQNFTRLASGAYSVRLPTKSNVDTLGDSYQRAFRRFKALEKKFENNQNLKIQYASFINEFASLNHMSLAEPNENITTYFLPHHCVEKLDSTTTKLRVVFDGSAKTTSGYSLNDLLLAGPTIQPKLFNTLLRFRFFKIALCGDICKMYRCVRVSHPDEYLQCILWRDQPQDEIKIYKLDTVTYGTKSAAFLATRAMHQLSFDEENSFPLGAKIVRRDFYVDDLISGGETIEEVIELRQQVKDLLQRGDFKIRKWCSNEPKSLHGVPELDREEYLKFHDGTDVTKTLGLIWDPRTDNFLFAFTPIVNRDRISKRSVLSAVARFYDPLGLLSPVIIRPKIFIQALWKEKLQWDESLPQSLQSIWIDMCAQFAVVSSFKFHRCVLMPQSTWEVHAFCDASLMAFGACVYIRSEYEGLIRSSLLCAKSRVAPLKTLTVPKLELSAALLLAELVASITKNFQQSCKVHCWSDSMVALSWIHEQPSNFNVFVSNRVNQIQTLTSGMTWHHVPTSLNPADILSRGCSPNELLHSELWKKGPPFLSEDSKFGLKR